MSSPRFLAVVFLLLPLTALAQNQTAVTPDNVPLPALAGSLFPHPDPLAATSPQLSLDSQRALGETKTPINLFEQSPSIDGDSPLSTNGIERPDNGGKPNLQLHPFDPSRDRMTIYPGEVCYSIRSYLMARDSKDSDSTHLVRVSNCLPARQYSLKTTDPQPHALQP
jgi:hypothetical protein